MTVAEANAANTVARELIALSKRGVAVSPALECAAATLLINAKKRLMAGFDENSFLVAMKEAKKTS